MPANSPTPGAAPAAAAPTEGIRFVNAMRLGWREWAAVAALVVLALAGIPRLWKAAERFETGADYRVPYKLSKDYWLWERRLERLAPSDVVLLGDSVIWGEYVRANGTLSHFLNEQSGRPSRFVNAGVNGLFPLALEGLAHDYAGPLRNRKVILHLNLLWMTSPKADLSTPKEERFNHADLVPQFTPRIPCYKAGLDHRLAAVVERHFPFAQWATHIQMTYFDQKNILRWTLEEDGKIPPSRPNAYKNPLSQITLIVPPEPASDPERGPESPRHKPWSSTGEGSTRFEWVELDRSLQWAAFQRLALHLRERGNEVLVVLGPFNEWILAPENRPAFQRLREGTTAWLAKNQFPTVAPETLPSALYADASHPLTEGYRRMAREIWNAETFQRFTAEPENGLQSRPASR